MNHIQRLIWICMFVLGFYIPVPAADPSWLEVVARDFAAIATVPAHLRAYPLQVGATAAVGVLMIYKLDGRVDDHYAMNNRGGLFHIPGAMNDVGEFYDQFGSSAFILSSAGALVAGGLLTKRSDVVGTAGIGVEAVLLTKIYTAFLKRTLSRARPIVGEGPRDFDFFSYGSAQAEQSMPSGHTSSIFAFVTVLTERHPSWWIRIPAFAFGTCVAVQRIESRNHWLSDTIFGAALGYGVGKTVSARHPIKDGADTGFRPFIFPSGLGMSYHF